MIERARAKRAWQATLPPLDEVARLPERQRMMEEQEALEWKYREEEIARIQTDRLAQLHELVDQREVATNRATESVLNLACL